MKDNYGETEDYNNLKRKREAIANGAPYKTYDATEQLVAMIAFVGGSIPTINHNTKGEPIPLKQDPALVAAEISRKWKETTKLKERF